MKKESVNTFNEGLNYDLNPITTPNNVLTDCVNGTFITFNGDELALQTDAGNTKIMVPGTEADPLYVKLSDGFYPLGIKEYGGILYIVSGKEPTKTVRVFSNLQEYNSGDIVTIEQVGINYYFESLHDNNGGALPYETTTNWLFIGTKNDYINKYGYVEFGSYPSPVVVNADRFNTSVNFEVINDENTGSNAFKSQLYSPKIINNSTFQAGVYVRFSDIDGSTLVTDNISYNAYTHNSITGEPVKDLTNTKRKIYKVKLYHQLTNGFIDLTENVWEKYAKYVYTTYGEELNTPLVTTRFWFNEDLFKYYCPHNFKGKLIVSVELEDLSAFTLYSAITTQDTDFETAFTLNYSNNTDWEIDNVIVYTRLDDSVDETSNTYPLSSFTVTSLSADAGKTLNYRIVPEFKFDGNIITEDYFPQEFIDRHTIIGSESLNAEVNIYKLYRHSNDNTCSITEPGYRIQNKLMLTDNNDQPLDETLTITVTPWYFYLAESISGLGTVPTDILGTYDIDENGYGTNVIFEANPAVTDLEEYFTNLIEGYQLKVADSTCTYVPLTVVLRKGYSYFTNPIVVYQNGNVVEADLISEVTDRFVYQILPGVAYTVKPNSSMGFVMDNSYFYTSTIASATTINYAVIIDLTAQQFLYTDPQYGDKIYVGVSASFFGSDNIEHLTDFTITHTDTYTGPFESPIDIQSGLSQVIYYYDELIGGQAPNYRIVFNGVTSDSFYANLNLIPYAVKGDNNIFLETYEL